MIFEVPAGYPDNYLSGLDFPLWIISVIIGIICSIIFLTRMKKSEVDIQKSLYLGMGLFLFLYALMRIAFLLSVKISNGDYYDEYTIIGYILGLGGFGGFLYGIERSIVKKTKYFLTIASFIVVIIGVLGIIFDFDRGFIMDLVYIVSLADTLLMLILYIWLIKMSMGVIRKRTIVGFIGILTIFLGMMFDAQLAYETVPNLPTIIAPIFTIVGLTVMTYIQRY